MSKWLTNHNPVLRFLTGRSSIDHKMPLHCHMDRPGGCLDRRRGQPAAVGRDSGDTRHGHWRQHRQHLALAMLLRSPELDVRLVTTAHGKAEYRAKLIARILTVAKRTEIPIGLGEGGRGGSGPQEPWVRDYRLSDYPGPIRQDGAAAMVGAIERSPRPVTLITIGPLETPAAAWSTGRRSPRAALVSMLGCVQKGYDGKHPWTDYNLVSNIPAARKVLSAPWRQIAVAPMETCFLVTLAGQRFETLKQSPDPLVRAVLENYHISAQNTRQDNRHASGVLWDTAAIYLAYPGGSPLMRLERLSITVTPDGFMRIDPAGRSMSIATKLEGSGRVPQSAGQAGRGSRRDTLKLGKTGKARECNSRHCKTLGRRSLVMGYQPLNEKSVINYVRNRPSIRRIFDATDHFRRTSWATAI